MQKREVTCSDDLLAAVDIVFAFQKWRDCKLFLWFIMAANSLKFLLLVSTACLLVVTRKDESTKISSVRNLVDICFLLALSSDKVSNNVSNESYIRVFIFYGRNGSLTF